MKLPKKKAIVQEIRDHLERVGAKPGTEVPIRFVVTAWGWGIDGEQWDEEAKFRTELLTPLDAEQRALLKSYRRDTFIYPRADVAFLNVIYYGHETPETAAERLLANAHNRADNA